MIIQVRENGSGPRKQLKMKDLNRKICKYQCSRIFRGASDRNLEMTLNWSISYLKVNLEYSIFDHWFEKSKKCTLKNDFFKFFRITLNESKEGEKNTFAIKIIYFLKRKGQNRKSCVDKVQEFLKTHCRLWPWHDLGRVSRLFEGQVDFSRRWLIFHK